MSNKQLKQYKVTVDRDTSQFLEVFVDATGEADATNQALTIAGKEETEWQESEFLGDAVVTLIELTDGEAIFNLNDVPPSSNIDVVTDIMTNSKYGALSQMFVMDALLKFSKLVMETHDDNLKSFDNGIVYGEAWRNVATEINQKLSTKYGS